MLPNGRLHVADMLAPAGSKQEDQRDSRRMHETLHDGLRHMMWAVELAYRSHGDNCHIV
jgi:hypothetical protein